MHQRGAASEEEGGGCRWVKERGVAEDYEDGKWSRGKGKTPGAEAERNVCQRCSRPSEEESILLE
jgi:hypothetical protein